MITPDQLTELERLRDIAHSDYTETLIELAPALIAAARENDLLRTRLASILFFGSDKLNQTKCEEIQRWAEEYPTAIARECEKLRTEVVLLRDADQRENRLPRENTALKKRVSELEELSRTQFNESLCSEKDRDDLRRNLADVMKQNGKLRLRIAQLESGDLAQEPQGL